MTGYRMSQEWPQVWEVTAQSKKYLDKLREKYAVA